MISPLQAEKSWESWGNHMLLPGVRNHRLLLTHPPQFGSVVAMSPSVPAALLLLSVLGYAHGVPMENLQTIAANALRQEFHKAFQTQQVTPVLKKVAQQLELEEALRGAGGGGRGRQSVVAAVLRDLQRGRRRDHPGGGGRHPARGHRGHDGRTLRRPRHRESQLLRTLHRGGPASALLDPVQPPPDRQGRLRDDVRRLRLRHGQPGADLGGDTAGRAQTAGDRACVAGAW
ncbi:hypothetical protein C7M84_008975 [Penaeus vannamei]|uniref:Uncharacterized protein n=1 Tax=Penaeus vannamei TaxID=6689 RepID=A0A3R7PI28_PENVA|nr:hypothetical protein C7M84_008975 [Penaeus vannamei]